MVRYAIRPERVVTALKEVREHYIHPHFAGYLAVRRVAAREKRPTKPADVTRFFHEFLSVRDVKGEFLYPFTDRQKADPQSIWFNDNPQGSYTQSSVREDGPFRQVIDFEGTGRQQELHLRKNHAKLAAEHLLLNKRLPGAATAIVLLRNDGFDAPAPPRVRNIVLVFQAEFGFLDKNGRLLPDYDGLFDTNEKIEDEGGLDWFEVLG